MKKNIIMIICCIVFLITNTYQIKSNGDTNIKIVKLIENYTNNLENNNSEENLKLIGSRDMVKKIRRISQKYQYKKLEYDIISIEDISDSKKRVTVKYDAYVWINVGLHFDCQFIVKENKDQWYIIDTNFEKRMLLTLYIGIYLSLSLIIAFPFIIHMVIRKKSRVEQVKWAMIMVFGSVFGIVFYLKSHKKIK